MSGSEAQRSPLLEQQQLVSRIAAGIASDLEESWTTIEYGTTVLYPYAQELSHITAPDGRVTTAVPSDEIAELVDELRELMYHPNTGTWFTFTLSIEKSGSVDADFDYDNEPAWSRPVEPVFYVQDLERFPRDEANIPEWLARELERGREQDAAYDRTQGPRKRITPITDEL